MSQTETKLAKRIKSYIRETGPIPVSEYMSLCLLDPTDGFYPTRDPLGSEGDFITAPEISQMFGEVLGLWVIQSWIDIGRPRMEPELSISRVTTVSLKSMSCSTL